MDYDAPETYHRLIAPRYAPIADALIDAAALQPGERVLEVGAGTGVVTTRAEKRLMPGGTLWATDLSPGMLEIARRSVRDTNASFAIVDYTAPLPFLDASFDVVLSALTYLQNSRQALEEVARVLRPGGRVALAMWGTYYGEVRLMSKARRAVGQSPYPSAAPGRAVRRLERAGFHRIARSDLEQATRFSSVEEYIAYRRGFGIPVGSSRAQHARFLEALRREALHAAADDGSLTLGWTVTVITARRPRRTR